MNDNTIVVHNEYGEVESKSTYRPELIARCGLKKSIFIPQGTILCGGLVKIECVMPFLELVIGIGEDHTARLIISEDALCALNNLKSEVTIF